MQESPRFSRGENVNDYCNNSTSDGDIDVAVELTPEQHKAVKKRFETQFKNAYGISIADAIKQECKLEG